VVALTLLVGPVSAGNESNYRYLALGDSVSFGLDLTLAPPLTPDRYIGYPEIVADFQHQLQSKKEVNASCPGQSSSSFIDFHVPDIGCQGFKRDVGLHTSYSGSQLAFAKTQLQNNKHIDLVTLSIGGNDLLILQDFCSHATSFPMCVEQFRPVFLDAYETNLRLILTTIRTDASYKDTLVLVKYYPLNTDKLFTATIGALNDRMELMGNEFGAKFADGFTAFQMASTPFQGDPCKAGLLVRLSPTTCDVHPSRLGQSVLAVTVLAAIAGR
jgi:lysophospholipase L1-like esterase